MCNLRSGGLKNRMNQFFVSTVILLLNPIAAACGSHSQQGEQKMNTTRYTRLLQLAAIAIVLVVLAIASVASADSPTKQPATPMLDRALAQIDAWNAKGKVPEGVWTLAAGETSFRKVDESKRVIVPIPLEQRQVSPYIVVPGYDLYAYSSRGDTAIFSYMDTPVRTWGFILDQTVGVPTDQIGCSDLISLPNQLWQVGDGVALVRMNGYVAVIAFTMNTSSIFIRASCSSLATGAAIIGLYSSPSEAVMQSQVLRYAAPFSK